MFFGYTEFFKSCDQNYHDHRQILLLFSYSTPFPCNVSLLSMNSFITSFSCASPQVKISLSGHFGVCHTHAGTQWQLPFQLQTAESTLETICIFSSPALQTEEALPANAPKVISPVSSQLSFKFFFEFIRINLLVCCSCCQDDKFWVSSSLICIH